LAVAAGVGAGGGPGGGRGVSNARPFSSGLGGQRENIHGQQGPDGNVTGGVFVSRDAGKPGRA